LFHLVNHSFFKCLLFIGAGFIIHALSNEQDLRKLGGLFKVLPYIYVLILFASVALMGLPYLSGFYSKEKILESSFYIFNNVNLLAFWLGSLSALFTAIYSTKLIYLSFFYKPNNYKRNYFTYFHFENKFYLNAILTFLGLGSVFSGYLLSDLIIGNATDLFLFNYNNINYYSLDFHIGNMNVNLLALFYTLIGFTIAFILFSDFINEIFINLLNSYDIFDKKYNYKYSYKLIYDFFSNRWYINSIYNRFIGNFFLSTGYHLTFLLMDQGYIHNGLGQLYFIRLFRAYLEIGLKLYKQKLLMNYF
jgi:NADH-ubiquinone oxidoreductase chain 5